MRAIRDTQLELRGVTFFSEIVFECAVPNYRKYAVLSHLGRCMFSHGSPRFSLRECLCLALRCENRLFPWRFEYRCCA